MARTYALADNFYAADADPDVAKQVATAADATLYQQLVDAAGAARSPLQDHGDDPEDYGRTGYLFNALARAGLTFRDYGGLLRLSGYDGPLYHLDVPALGALAGNVDLDYPGYNPEGDRRAARADEFVRDMQRYVEADRCRTLRTSRCRAAIRRPPSAMPIAPSARSSTHLAHAALELDGDLRGPGGDRVAAPITSTRCAVTRWSFRRWRGADSSADEHLSVASVVKTEEEIFGLPPLTLNDLLASDLAPFSPRSGSRAYQAPMSAHGKIGFGPRLVDVRPARCAARF